MNRAVIHNSHGELNTNVSIIEMFKEGMKRISTMGPNNESVVDILQLYLDFISKRFQCHRFEAFHKNI